MSNLTAPTLVSATPADNTGAVIASADIVLTFSEAIAAGNGLITISDGATQTYMGKDGVMHTRLIGATDTRTVSISDTSQVTISGNTVTINLASDLLSGKSYSVQMGKGAVLDTAGNAYAGLTDTTRLKFTTVPVSTPTAVVDGIGMMTDTGVSATDFITNSTAQTVGGKYSGTLATGDFIEVSLDDGATWVHAAASGDTWTASGAIDTGSTSVGTLIARVSNAAGNHTAAVRHTYTFDTTAPTVTSMVLGDDHLSTGETATVTVTFSEAVTGLDTSDFTVTGGVLSNLATSDSGKTWTATLTPTANVAEGAGQISLNAGGVADLAGNGGPSAASNQTFSYSTAATAPAATIASAGMTDTGSSSTDFITNATAQTISGTLSAALASGEKVEVSLDHGATWTDATVDGTTWRLTGQTISHSDTLVARVSNGAAHGTEYSHAYTLDQAAPTATVALNHSQLVKGQTAVITATFSEAVTGLTSADFKSNDAIGTPVSTDGGITWTATLTPTNNGYNTVTLYAAGVTDLAGNSGPAADIQSSYQYDATPTVTIASAAITDTGTSASDFITNATSQTITGTLSGALASDEYVQVSMDGGATWNRATNNGTSWSLSQTISASGTLKVRVADSTTHGTEYSHAYTLDQSAPAAPTIAISDTSLVLGESATVTVTFGEKIASLPASDFSVAGGALGTFTTTDGGITWSARLTPDAASSGSGNVILQSGAVQDLAGNTGPANAASAVFGYDMRVPVLTAGTLSFSADTGDEADDFITYTGAQTITGSYSNPVNAGSKIEVSADGSTWTTAATNGESHQWSASMTLSGSGTLHVRLTDALGTVSEQTQSYTIDTTIGSLASRSVDLASSSDSAGTGGSSSDDITNVDTPTVQLDLYNASGLQAGDYVDVLDLSNGSAVVGTHMLTSSELASYGNKVSLVLDQLSTGSHQLVMRAHDAAGNQGTQSSSALTVTIDQSTASMASKTIDLAAASDSGSSATDNITNDNTPTVTVNVANTSNLSAGDVLQIVDASDSDAVVGAYTLTSSNYGAYGGDISITLSTLGDGEHALKLRVYDKAGNYGDKSAATTVTVDTTAPTLLSSSPSSGATEIGTGTSALTLTFSEALDVDSRTGFKIANSAVVSDVREIVFEALSGNTGTYNDSTHAVTLSLSGALQYDGNYAVTVYNQALSDLAGNSIADGTSLLAFKSESAPTPPGAVTLSLAESAYASHSGTDSDYITNHQLSVSGISASHLEYRTSSSNDWTSVTFSGTTASITLPDGTYAAGDIQVRQYNVSGYESTSATLAHSWTIDRTVPTAYAAAPGSDFFGIGSLVSLSSDITGEISGTLNSASEFIEYTTDGGSTWNTAASATSSGWTLSSLKIDSGGYVGLRVTDQAGNLGSHDSLAGYVVYVGDGYGGTFTASGNMSVYAMGGNDTVTANSSGNTVYGGNGDDTITVNGSANTVYGGNGSDTITVNAASATVYGDDGDDTISLSSSLAASDITGLVDGGSSTSYSDTLTLTRSGQDLTLANLSAHVAHFEKIQLSSGTDITISAAAAADLSDGSRLTILGDSTDKIVVSSSEWTPAVQLQLLGYSGYYNAANDITLVYSSAITIDTGVT